MHNKSFTKGDIMKTYSLKQNKQAVLQGFKDGIPIGLGYFAVAFSLGIAAKNAGLTPFQAFITSALCHASAGEYAGFTVIAAAASFLEMAVITLIANARYLLMSCAMSQRLDPKMPFFHRLIMSFFITDELFGIAIARPGHLNPWYSYGAVLFASPCWAVGTALGAIAGNLLPLRLVSAFSVALYGMFLAIFIPPARKDKVILGIVVLCFFCSGLTAWLPATAAVSEGTRTIFLTLVISAGAAYFFPRKQEEEVTAHE